MMSIAEQMKANKEQVYQEINQLKQKIDRLINDITVRSEEASLGVLTVFCLEYVHDCRSDR